MAEGMNNRIQDLIWIVDTHSGDGFQVFRDFGPMLVFVHSLKYKNCTVTAVTRRGEKVLTTDVISGD
jgi:hypothetical protein